MTRPPPADPRSPASCGRPRLLELYCGIGGCAAAVGEAAEVVGAVDIDRRALAVYRHNYPRHPTAVRALESISTAELAAFGADLWWLSPPCQPFTRRGLGRDDRDPRSASLLALIDRLAEVRPRWLALENVPGFRPSRTARRLREALAAAGYRWRELDLCPTDLGWPNRRRRYYLVAGRRPLADPPDGAGGPDAGLRPLADFLDPEADAARPLAVDPALARRYRRAIDVVDPGVPRAVAATFTSAYGRSPVRSGSYVATADGLRRFSPAEALALLGFPRDYSLPPGLDVRAAWSLVGNSLSVPAVRRVLSAVPALAALATDPAPG